MVRNYQRKSDRGKWCEEAMMQAVMEVVNGRMGSKRAADTFSIPQTTLERKVKKFKSEGFEEIPEVYSFKERLGPISTTFSVVEEQELVVYIKDMESRLFGLNTHDLRKLAFQLAVKNNKKHCFNDTKEEAGKDWVKAFLKRNPSLSIRKPQSTSIARAMAFNKENVGKFFSLLGELYDVHKFTPDRIYNCDESGISAVSKSTSKILATKGKKQVGSLSSADRGKTVSVEICMSASGLYMPPLLVYPRQRMKPELLNNGSPGMWAECHVSGWMQKDIFESWFEKFIQFSGATKEKPVLLLLDGHSTHVKSLKIIDRARESGVVILCLPPHCTHRLQPLDVTFMKPLSVFYDQEVTNWLRSNPGKAVTMAQIAEILGKSFLRAATMTTAINGFRYTGIWPYNANIFPESAFVASTTTDRPIPENSLDQTNTLRPSLPVPMQSKTAIDNQQPECSHWATSNPEVNDTDEDVPVPNQHSNSQGAFAISPEQIMPPPHVGRKNVRQTKHRKGKTVVVTGSPYKRELQESEKKKDHKELKNGNKNQKVTKKLLFNNSKSEGCTKKKDTKKRNGHPLGNSSSKDEEDESCLYCGYFYSQSDEAWVLCVKCSQWAHCSCAGEEDEDDETYHICDFCK